MNQVTFAVIFAVGAIISLTIGLIVVQRRSAPGSLPFVVLMGAVAWWEASRALEAVATGLPAKVFLSQLQYFGVAVVPVAWLWFAMSYAGYAPRLKRTVLLILWLVPALLILTVFTNQWHWLYWSAVTPGSNGPQDNLVYSGGILFWVFLAVNYAFILVGTILMVRAVLTSRELYRRQAVAILVAALIPWTANAAYVFGLVPLRGLDVLALTVGGTIWFFSLYRYRFFELVPVAYDLLVQSMSDGVIVLDVNNRIAEINAAALEFLGKKDTPLIGEAAERALDVLPRWSNELASARAADTEVEMAVPAERYLHLRMSPLLGRSGVVNGRLIILQDITIRKRAEHELQRANLQLHTQLLEIQELHETLHEQAMRDPLTGLYNRRFLYEILARELEQAQRAQHALCLIMLDIDEFKSFNDSYGHRAGDRMLTAFAAWLEQQARRGDVVCRYGGEEFVVVLPDTHLDDGIRRAEAWRLGLSEYKIAYEGMTLCATGSLGVAAYPLHGETPEELLRMADMALYAAKAAGRNCVRAAPDMLFTLEPRHIEQDLVER